jgi:hypothetical protein
LFHQVLELLISGNSLLERRDLVLRDVTRNIPTLFPGLVIVVGALGSRAQDAELAPFHVLDLSDLLQEQLRSDLSGHGPEYIAIYIQCPQKKSKIHCQKNFVSHPFNIQFNRPLEIEK